MCLTPPLKGFPLEFGIGARVKELERWGYQMVEKFQNRFSRSGTIPPCDGQTSGHATTAKTLYSYMRRAVKTSDRILILWPRKSPLYFGSHPDLALDPGIFNEFLPAPRIAYRGICYGNVAGWLGVCPSHAGIVSKRLNLS